MREELVSVVIPTYNRKEIVTRCVNSVMNSTYSNIEVIIVDNASTDDTFEALLELKHGFGQEGERIHIVGLPTNLMASGGRNAGILRVQGEYVLFVDDDNEIYPDMIELLVEAFKKDEKLGLAAPLAFNGGVSWTTSINYNWWTSRCHDTFPECVGKTEDYADRYFEERYQTWAGSPNVFMVSRHALDSVGGFDYSMYMTFEEGDFACRIIRAGFSEYIYTKPRTNHFGWVRSQENTRLRRLCIEPANRAYYFCRNRTVFMKRYARWYHLISYYLVFFHLFTAYYMLAALSEKRIDIAWAVLSGSWKGLFIKNDKRICIPIEEDKYLPKQEG